MSGKVRSRNGIARAPSIDVASKGEGRVRATVRRPSLHGSRGAELRAIEAITERIRNRTYAPGEHLSESRLVADLELSRNTVREALRFLAASGMLQREPNKGARVVLFDRDSVTKVYQLREVVEGLAAKLCAMNINLPGNRKRLFELLEQIDRTLALPVEDARNAFFEHNASFHNVLMEIANNHHLDNVTRQLNVPALRREYFDVLSADDLVVSIEEHRQIAFAIIESDASRAEALMRAHVFGTFQRLIRLPDEKFERIYA